MAILRRIFLTLAFLIFFLSLLETLFVKQTNAQGKNELLPKDQVIESDYIRAAESIQIDGEIKGDAFLAGGLVTVNGPVDGDLFIMGGKVNINGPVGNSVRVISGDVTVNNFVNRNALLVCGNCSITKAATIAGSLIVAGGNLDESAGKIGKGFRFFGSRLFLNSAVSNEAFVVADQEFLLGPEASISGELKYTGKNEVTLEPGATVGGHIAYQQVSQDERYPRFFGARGVIQAFDRVRPLTDFAGFLISALVGFILLGLFPKFFEKVTGAIENQPYASLGWGIIAIMMLPVLVVLLALTIVGIPVAVLLAIVAYVVLLAAKYLIAFYIGRRILLFRFQERRGWALVLGLFLIYLLGLVPWVGNLIKGILMLFAVGGMILCYRHPVLVEQKELPFENAARNKKK